MRPACISSTRILTRRCYKTAALYAAARAKKARTDSAVADGAAHCDIADIAAYFCADVAARADDAGADVGAAACCAEAATSAGSAAITAIQMARCAKASV